MQDRARLGEVSELALRSGSSIATTAAPPGTAIEDVGSCQYILYCMLYTVYCPFYKYIHIVFAI